jgi:hypothetical protein
VRYRSKVQRIASLIFATTAGSKRPRRSSSPTFGVIKVAQYLVPSLHIQQIVWLSLQLEWNLARSGNLRYEDTDHFRRGRS